MERTEKSQEFQAQVAAAGLDIEVPMDKDRISIKADALRLIDDHVAKLYAESLELSALITGVEQRRKYIGADGRVHPIHDQLSANTGRISTSEPAMSNLPRSGRGDPLRRATEAPEGWVFSDSDLGQIELRAQAHHTGEPTMIMLFNLPLEDPRSDIYRLFASWVQTELLKREVKVEEIPAGGE
jgi:DNA polymerase I-like protein with 3'-5' exonuclease and polymerase domains